MPARRRDENEAKLFVWLKKAGGSTIMAPLMRKIQGLSPFLTRIFKLRLPDMYQMAKAYVKRHPYVTVALLISLILIANPVAIAGFGVLGPGAGTFAAAWQATMGGYVAAGSLFATLQSIGMVGALAIPMSGLALAVLALALPKLKEWFEGSRMYDIIRELWTTGHDHEE